jgi:nicotinamidase-related amidase
LHGKRRLALPSGGANIGLRQLSAAPHVKQLGRLKVGNMKTAILVIDVQEGLCVGPQAAHDCAGTIERINSVTRCARAAGVPVIFIQHESRTGYLEYCSPEWQLARGLEVGAADLRVRKTTPDAFLGTDLNSLLQEREVQELVVCGMHSEFCVDTTTRKALALGYPVVLIADGHTSAGNEALSPLQVIAHHNATLKNISSFGPRVRTVLADEFKVAAT